MNLQIKKIVPRVVTFDAQPCGQDGSILCVTTGDLKLDEEANSQCFTHIMILINNGNYVLIKNEVFRLNYSQ